MPKSWITSCEVITRRTVRPTGTWSSLSSRLPSGCWMFHIHCLPMTLISSASAASGGRLRCARKAPRPTAKMPMAIISGMRRPDHLGLPGLEIERRAVGVAALAIGVEEKRHRHEHDGQHPARQQDEKPEQQIHLTRHGGGLLGNDGKGHGGREDHACPTGRRAGSRRMRWTSRPPIPSRVSTPAARRVPMISAPYLPRDRVEVKTQHQQLLDGRADCCVVAVTSAVCNASGVEVYPEKVVRNLAVRREDDEPAGVRVLFRDGIVRITEADGVGQPADRRFIGAGEEMPAGVRAGARVALEVEPFLRASVGGGSGAGRCSRRSDRNPCRSSARMSVSDSTSPPSTSEQSIGHSL